MDIRRAILPDAPAIAALIDLYVPDGTLLPRTPEFIAMNTRDFIVALDGGELVGCVHLDEYAPSLAEVRSLAVAPGWQTKGVGRALMYAVEALAKKRGYTTLFAVSNSGEFFQRFGYAERYIPELDEERSEVSRYKALTRSAWPTRATPPPLDALNDCLDSRDAGPSHGRAGIGAALSECA
jgi:amino-acid N-acetyltransferase